MRALEEGGAAGEPTPDHDFRIVDTRFVGRPADATFERRPRFQFRFVSAGQSAGVSFECSLDRHRYRPCASPYRTERLGFGRHALRIRTSTQEAGTDPSPARHAFRVERRRVVFGRSVRGRALVAVRVGDPSAARTALVVGSIHGDETEGHEIAGRIRRQYRGVSGVDLWVVQTVNPDGVARHTRKNAHGVDLNRNFGYRWSGSEPASSGYYAGPKPFSEPEARAVSRLTKRVRPRVTIWYHQPWGAVLVPCGGSAPIPHKYAQLAGMPTSCRGAGLPGTATSWQNHRLPGHAFVVELAAGELPDKQAKRHARAVIGVVRR